MSAIQKIKKNYQLYLLLLPGFILLIVFKYVPMYGVLMAFQDYSFTKGVLGSHWVGLEYFRRFFNSYQFWDQIKNTISLSIYQLVLTFPLPIVLALMLNQLTKEKTKKFIQTVLYAPYFISTVVLVGMMYVVLSPSSGIVNKIIVALGGKTVFFLADPGWFSHLYVFSSVWQGTGWAAVIYIAALSSIDPQLHEAAIMDGASKFKRILCIDLPSILPVIVIQLILALGNLMNVGFEKALLLQTNLNLDKSEIIQTYVYKVGVLQGQYGYSAAVGLFNAVINVILLITVNQIVKRHSETSLW
jgi:putative aldouronate transport system permease protein